MCKKDCNIPSSSSEYVDVREHIHVVWYIIDMSRAR